MPTSTRALIWAAVSTREQADDAKASIPAQVADAERLAAEKGWTIIDTLVVPGHSRSKHYSFEELKRAAKKRGIDAFVRLEQHWLARDFDVIIIRDANRFARRNGPLGEIGERVVDFAGASIYSMTEGLIDARRLPEWLAFNGFRARSEARENQAKWKAGLERNIQKGLPTNKLSRTHFRVRDSAGKTIGVAVSEEWRPLWNTVRALLLEGMAWLAIEGEIYQRGYRDERGLPLQRHFLRNEMYSPTFWGHSARYFYKRIGPWAYDEGEAPPEGVILNRNTHPPVFDPSDPDTARLKAELTRRHTVIRGRASPSNTFPLTGLLACPNCGRSLGSMPGASFKAHAYRCGHKYNRRGNRCVGIKNIRYRDAKHAISVLLGACLKADDVSLLAPDNSGDVHRLEQMRVQLSKLEAQVNILITEQLESDPASRKFYAQRITAASRQAEDLGAQIAELENRIEAPVVAQDRRLALDELRQLTIDNLWGLDNREINQLLHRLFRGTRLVIEGDQVARLL